MDEDDENDDDDGDEHVNEHRLDFLYLIWYATSWHIWDEIKFLNPINDYA